MKINWEQVDEQVTTIAARRSSITIGDKRATLVLLTNRLTLADRQEHRQRLDAINDDLKALAAIRQVEARLIEAMTEALVAGIYAASDAAYVPANPEVARLLTLAWARLGTATLEGRDLQDATGQTIGENG